MNNKFVFSIESQKPIGLASWEKGESVLKENFSFWIFLNLLKLFDLLNRILVCVASWCSVLEIVKNARFLKNQKAPDSHQLRPNFQFKMYWNTVTEFLSPGKNRYISCLFWEACNFSSIESFVFLVKTLQFEPAIIAELFWPFLRKVTKFSQIVRS